MTIELTLDELRAVTAYAVACATPALTIFELARPDDPRPRDAIAAAKRFADGAPRTKHIRDAAWAAQRAYQETRDAGQIAASEAARSAVATCGAAYLHPLAKATQVKHILGAAEHAVRAAERHALEAATATVVDVLKRYPEVGTPLDRELRRGLNRI